MILPSAVTEAARCRVTRFQLLNQHFQADKTGDLNVVEVFKLEHHVAVLRREYVESYEGRNPPSVTKTQMKKALSLRGKTSCSLTAAQKLPRSFQSIPFLLWIFASHPLMSPSCRIPCRRGKLQSSVGREPISGRNRLR